MKTGAHQIPSRLAHIRDPRDWSTLEKIETDAHQRQQRRVHIRGNGDWRTLEKIETGVYIRVWSTVEAIETSVHQRQQRMAHFTEKETCAHYMKQTGAHQGQQKMAHIRGNRHDVIGPTNCQFIDNTSIAKLSYPHTKLKSIAIILLGLNIRF